LYLLDLKIEEDRKQKDIDIVDEGIE
jgi:ATP-binding cassette subfamily B (MDR/TAP) protein 1